MILILFFVTFFTGNVGTFWVGSGSGDDDGTSLCRLPDGNFPNPDDCTSFVRCQSGVSDTESCPQGLLFNPFTFTCDFSKTGNCSHSADFDSTSAALPTTDIECPEDGPNIYSIVSSCSEYYLCDNGVAFRMACPPTLQMNPDKLTCDYEENVDCDMTSSKEETSVGITAIYETNTEDSETITDESITISETSVDPNTAMTSVQATETPQTTVEKDFSDPTSSESISESATTSEISDLPTTKEISLTSTTMKYVTSESATEYTVNKQPTIVTVSTAQTREVAHDFTETSSDPVKLISDDETEISDYFTESTLGIVTENITDQNTINIKTSSDIEITDIFPSETSPGFTENTVSDHLATKTERTSVSVLDISSTNTEISYDSTKPEIFQRTTTENYIEDKSRVASLVTADTETDTEGISSVKHSTTLVSFGTENDGNEFTAMEITDTSELNTSIDDTANTLTTTQNILTTNVSSEITPEKSKSTTITLMSSDPSTDNETIEFSTTTEYKNTDASILYTHESTINSKSSDFEVSIDTVTSTRLTDSEPVTEGKTIDISTKFTTETFNDSTEYKPETSDTSSPITDAETISTYVRPTSDGLKTTNFSSTELASTKNVDQDISTSSTTTKTADISEITETTQSNTFESSKTDFSTFERTTDLFTSKSTEHLETTTSENKISITSETDSFVTSSATFSKETETDEYELKVTTSIDESTEDTSDQSSIDTFTSSTTGLTYTTNKDEFKTSSTVSSVTNVESTLTSNDETAENTYKTSTDNNSTRPILISTSTFESTKLTTDEEISKSSDVADETTTFPSYISPSTSEQTVSESFENTTKTEDNTSVLKFSTDFTDVDKELSTINLSTPSEDAINTQTDLTLINLSNETTFAPTTFFSISSSDSNGILTSTFNPLSTLHTTEDTTKSSTEDTTLKHSNSDYDSKTISTLPTTSDRTSVSIASITEVTFEETKNYSETHPDEITTKTSMPVSSTTERTVFETTFETFVPSKITRDLKSTLNPTTLEISTHDNESTVTDSIDENISVSTISLVPLSTTDKTSTSTEYETFGPSLTTITAVTDLTDDDEIFTTESKLNTELESNVTTKTTFALSNETLYTTNADSSKSNSVDFSISTENREITSVSSDLLTENVTSDYTQTMTSLSTSLRTETSENNVDSTTIQNVSTNSEIQPDTISTLSASTLSLTTDLDTSETQTILSTTSKVDTTLELTTIYSSTSKQQFTSENTESTFVSSELNTESSSDFQDTTTELNNLTNFTLVTNQTGLETLGTTDFSTQFKETSTGIERTTTKLPNETPTDFSSTVASESDYVTSTIDQNQFSKASTETSSVSTLEEATTTDSITESSSKTVLTTSISDLKTSSEETSSFSNTTESMFNTDTGSISSQTTELTSDDKYTSDKITDLIGSTTTINITVETDSENVILTTETSLSSDLPNEETSPENSTPKDAFPTAENSSYRTTDLETSESTIITDGHTLSTSTVSNETRPTTESSSSRTADLETSEDTIVTDDHTLSTSTVSNESDESSGTYVTDDMSWSFSSSVSEHSTIDINHETHSTTVSENTDSDSSVSDQTESVTSKPTNKVFSTISFTDLTTIEDITEYMSSTGVTSSHYTEKETDKTSSDYSTITEPQTPTLPSETTTVNSICLTADGFYPNPDDCHSFYECSKGIPKLSLCIENDHFNPIRNICEDPCTAKCDPNANCPTTESERVSTESLLTSSNYPFTETGGSSLYTVITSEIQTRSTIFDDLSSVSDETSKSSTDSEVSSSDFISVSENPFSTDETATTSITDQDKQTTTDLSSVFTDTATSKSSATIFTGSYTSDHSESVTHTYLSSTTMERTSSQSTSNDDETEPFSSTERTFVTDGLSSISTNELQTDITEESSYRTDSSDSDKIITGAFTTDDSDDSSYDTDDNIDDTSLRTSPTSVTSSKCGNEGCSTTKVPVLSTPVPYRVCHLNDFLSRPNCSEYVDCTERIPKKKECPLGLYFNPTTRVCDWPYKAGCGETGQPLYKPDESFECPCKSCLIPSPKSCSRYYLCLGYTAYHLQCSNSLLFDKALNTCNYSPLVNCLEPSSTTVVTRKPTTASTTKRTTPRRTTTTTTPTSQPKRFVCPSREGLFRYPGNCGMFYQCSNWYPYAMHCAATTHFSEITKNCDYPCNAKCDLTLSCVKHTTAAPSDPRCTCRNCKLPLDETCTRYIVCVNGKARLENCPWGQTYDAKRAICDWAHRVDCRHSEICPERNGMFVHKDDCHKFVHCSNGIPYVKKCPANLEFDSIKKRCEWPAGRCSDIESSIPKEFEVFMTPEKKGGWRCPKSFGYFADDHDCNKFYHCSYGTPSLKECSEGLLYNPRYQNCDWKKHVRCQSNRHSSPNKCRVYDRHATCSSDRKPLPHSHCNMYYDCTAGRACAKQCPVGLYFNRTTGICDLPSNVKCFHPDKNDYSLRDFGQKCLSHDRGHMSSPTDAACFYRCRSGKVIPGCCSRGYVYNEHRDRCERVTKSYRL